MDSASSSLALQASTKQLLSDFARGTPSLKSGRSRSEFQTGDPALQTSCCRRRFERVVRRPVSVSMLDSISVSVVILAVILPLPLSVPFGAIAGGLRRSLKFVPRVWDAALQTPHLAYQTPHVRFHFLTHH